MNNQSRNDTKYNANCKIEKSNTDLFVLKNYFFQDITHFLKSWKVNCGICNKAFTQERGNMRVCD